MILMLLLTGT